jgi:hypothetical protein
MEIGTILKSFLKIPEQHNRKQSIKEAQKTAILGTAHTMRQLLMQDYSSSFLVQQPIAGQAHLVAEVSRSHTIPGDRNVIKKEAEKILKYKDLTIETQRMWKVKPNVIPVIIGATGTISKSFRKYLSNVPGIHEVKELQKTAILGTAHILRKVLM